MKIADEVHFCFGVALVDGVGAWLDPFERAGKKIFLHSTFEKMVSEETKCVQQLNGICAPWVVNQRPPNALHFNDPFDEVKGAGKKKSEQFQKVGMPAVADLVGLTELPEGFTAKLFATLKSKLPSSIPPTASPSIDHR